MEKTRTSITYAIYQKFLLFTGRTFCIRHERRESVIIARPFAI